MTSFNHLLLKVVGDSMKPHILDGEVVLVDSTYTEIQEGEIYAFTYNGKAFIKMIEDHKKEEFENVKIEGRVVKVISERNL
ncbi:S24 family peptidase [Fusobacterium sp.]|uniref:S24 family peptidase n=1 Tax=Fusobacterium sp. TaxID=68766 RepID=UPI002904A777|nr:S24 family peptidase [Fusobacterium sp.]MDU1909712.1 S24 family peptidase [Fusobacterium sp.]